MKKLLLKRNGSTTLLRKSLSFLPPEEEREGDALVDQFLSELGGAGVKLIRDEGRRGNHFRFEQGKTGVEVSLHGATQRWWGVAENYVKKVEKGKDHWGVVFLTPTERFWVDGRNFRTVVTGDLDAANGYNVHLDRLKGSSSANRFSSVREFLSISGLRSLP